MVTRSRTPPDTSIWFYAIAIGRTYVTPEDVTKAVNAGAKDRDLWAEVLLVIASKLCEDPSACASNALYNPKKARSVKVVRGRR